MTIRKHYTTKRNYFVSIDDDLKNIQKKLHSIINQIDDFNTDLDGQPRQVTDIDASMTLYRLQKVLDQYKGVK